MEGENHSDYGYEHLDHMHGLPGMGHAQEYAENVHRKQRDDHHLDGPYDYVLELRCQVLQPLGTEECHSQSQQESEYQGRHHIHHRRNVNGEIWFQVLESLRHFMTRIPPDQFRENRHRGPIRKQSGEYGVAIGNQDGNKQQPSGSLSDV